MTTIRNAVLAAAGALALGGAQWMRRRRRDARAGLSHAAQFGEAARLVALDERQRHPGTASTRIWRG